MEALTSNGRAGAPGPGRPRVLYVVSRFPTVSETFVVDEWWRLESRFRLEFAALVHTRQPALHPAVGRLLPRVRFVPAASRSTLRANAALLLRRPRVYAGVLAAVLRGSRGRRAGGAAKGAVVFWKSVALAREVDRLGVGHVHAHFASHPATAAWVIHRLTGVPFSFTAHANDLYLGPALLEQKASEARFVVAVSDYNRRWIERGVPAARVVVVHCGVDGRSFAPAAREPGSGTICVARLERKKGHADLLRAVAALAPEFPDLRVDLVGSGPERRRLEQLARSLRIVDRVRLLGSLPAPAVAEALRRARLFVLPCVRDGTGRMDGVPVALVEAMASGVPVVTTTVSGIPELVRDGDTGLAVAPGRPDELAAAMRRLLLDPPLADTLASAGRRHVAAHWNADVESDRLAGLLARSLREGR